MNLLFCYVAMCNLIMPPPDVAKRFFETQAGLLDAWAKQYHTEVPRETAPAPIQLAVNDEHVVFPDKTSEQFGRSYLHRVQ